MSFNAIPQAGLHFNRLVRSTAIHGIDLFIEGPEVVEPANQEEASRDKPEDSRHDFTHVKSMNSEDSEERLQNPGKRVIDLSTLVSEIRMAIHARDEEHVDQPANAKETGGEKPDRTRNWPSVVEAMSSREPNDPQEISNGLAVRILMTHSTDITDSKNKAMRFLTGA